jgi:poly(A) polymerase
MPKPLSLAIKKVKQWLGNDASPLPLDPHIIGRDNHCISRKHISQAALNTISGLRKAGFQGFLVGGGVRDLLLGMRPKDFDVATNATPEQVRKIFRNSRIIGRRFKIVHVRFGREVIEVTTYRGHHKAEENDRDKRSGNQKSVQSKNGMLLRDNVFGTVEEDALRRDFTINALYYTTADFSVYDYTNGLHDLKEKTIRIIGDPSTRYREDPVRLLRAVRFAAKLQFILEPKTAAPIKQLAPSLSDIPAARMFDEILKLFMGGYGVRTFELMNTYNLFAPLFPQTAQCLENESNKSQQGNSKELVLNALKNTDKRIKAGKPVTPAFIFASLLWPAVQHKQSELMADGVAEIPALHQAAQIVASTQQKNTAIPKRFGMPMKEIWDLQLRLPKRAGHKAEQLIENRRFRAAYDFLLLREQSGEHTDDLGKWWTDYQLCTPEKRQDMVNSLQRSGGARRKRAPRTKKSPQIETH